MGLPSNDSHYGCQTWTGPDGFSYEAPDVLDRLCKPACRSWREQGSHAHLVWALAGSGTEDWIERDYRILSVRGAARPRRTAARSPGRASTECVAAP